MKIALFVILWALCYAVFLRVTVATLAHYDEEIDSETIVPLIASVLFWPVVATLGLLMMFVMEKKIYFHKPKENT